MEAKACYRCHEVKLLTDYHKRRDKTTGVCKACNAHRVRLIYAAMPPEQKQVRQEKNNLYAQKPENILRKKNRAKNRRLNNLPVEQEKSRVNYQKNTDAILAYQRANLAKSIKDLSLVYLNRLLDKNTGKKFPVELLEAKRVQVQIRRELMRVKINHQELTREERV